MGTTELGKDTRLFFSATEAGAYVPLGGEKSFDWNQASNDVDTSDKDGPSGVLIPGRYSFSVNGNVKLPDAGVAIVYAAKKSGAFVYVKAMKGTDVRFHGAVTVGNWKGSFGSDAPVPYSFDMANAGAPIVDDLGADA